MAWFHLVPELQASIAITLKMRSARYITLYVLRGLVLWLQHQTSHEWTVFISFDTLLSQSWSRREL